MGDSSNHKPIQYAAYTFIYLFHMPAFIAIAGYLSGRSATDKSLKSAISTLLIPYFIFEALISLLRLLITGNNNFDFLIPSTGLWFLLALFMMRAITPFLTVLRYPTTVTLIISIFVGYLSNPGTFLTLGRFFALLPFYCLGLVIYQKGYYEKVKAFSTKRIVLLRTASIIFLLSVTLALLIFRSQIFEEKLERLFYYKDSAKSLQLGLDFLWIRPTTLLISATVAIAVLLLVPRRNTFLELWGRNSINIYLLHIVIINIFVWIDLPDLSIFKVFLIASVGGIALTALFGSPITDRIFRPIMRGKHTWLYRK